MLETLYVYRFVFVIILLGIASVLLKRADEIPLALRGLARTLRKTAPAGAPDAPPPVKPVPAPVWKRVLAFLLILSAFVLAVL